MALSMPALMRFDISERGSLQCSGGLCGSRNAGACGSAASPCAHRHDQSSGATGGYWRAHDAGSSARIDHRSYDAQGIDREPKPHIPGSIVYA